MKGILKRQLVSRNNKIQPINSVLTHNWWSYRINLCTNKNNEASPKEAQDSPMPTHAESKCSENQNSPCLGVGGVS